VSLRGTAINRTQALVLAFFMLAWAGVITILAAAPQVYDQTLGRAPGSLRAAETAFVIGLSALVGVIAFGVIRRWRWLFWLILAVFFLGVLRLPVTALQLSGLIAAGSPPGTPSFRPSWP
jgi:cell division protein FtsW (lipid II flippase)